MSQQELLTAVVTVLEGAGVEYMITGSIASSLQGEPRATHAIDVVVALPTSGVGALLAAFPPPDYYLDENAAREAIASKGLFNLLAIHEGDKVDFWMLTDEPFDQSRFARRYPEEVFGNRLWVPTPEDTILEKLRWMRESGGTEKHFGDAVRVYEVHSEQLDQAYVEAWVARLSLGAAWARLRAEAEPI